MWGYQNVHVLKFLEEAMAETVGTGSFRAGIKLAATGYRISFRRVVAEVSAYLAVTAGGMYGAYKVMQPSPPPPSPELGNPP